MARLFTSGNEAKDTAAAVIDASGVTTTTVVRSGLAAWKCDSGNSPGVASVVQSGGNITMVASTSYWSRAYMRFDNLPASTVSIFAQQAAPAIRLTSGGVFQLWDMVTVAQVGSDGPTIVAGDGAWHRIELKVVVDATPVMTLMEASVDGVIFASVSVSHGFSGNAVPLAGWATTPGANKVCYVDDYALNDSTGAAQNSYPGEGSIVMLFPTGDSAKGTGWTNDAGTTTNLFDAVDNTPPVGIADTTASTGLHQIRNATSNANVSYDATMTSYQSAGLGPNDTVTVVVPLIVTGAPTGTGAKQGTVGVVSNPTIANVALGSPTAGAFFRDVAAGTYSSGWKLSLGTTTYNPTVTRATSPVMRVTQVTSSTRVSMVAFMGMYVEYIPGPLPYVNPMPPLIAQ